MSWLERKQTTTTLVLVYGGDPGAPGTVKRRTPACDGVWQMSMTSVTMLCGWLPSVASTRVSSTSSDGGLFSVTKARLPPVSKIISRTSVPCAKVFESANDDCGTTVTTSASAMRNVAMSGLTLDVTYHKECGSVGSRCASWKAPWRPVASAGKNSADSDSSACDGARLMSMTETWPVARCDTTRRRPRRECDSTACRTARSAAASCRCC